MTKALPLSTRRFARADQNFWLEAGARGELCEAFIKLRARGLSLREASRVLGVSPSFFSGIGSLFSRYRLCGVPALLPGKWPSARRSRIARAVKPIKEGCVLFYGDEPVTRPIYSAENYSHQ